MIRQALPEDAPQIAPLIILAMGPLAAKFANTDDTNATRALFERFIGEPLNQYSYQNILVDTEEDAIRGMIMGYDGAQLDVLRSRFLDYIRGTLGFEGTPEDETSAGEFYIDCLAVYPQYQGLGIAKELLKSTIEKAAANGHAVVGLLADVDNHKAQKLYTSMGFTICGKKYLLGGQHYHMQHNY
ncbi:N-acetyltransferase [Mucilaginibacter terrenus]|uniref:N-acetyltransferase n=1 Tax=Mucilaginibacter terrenus TaxID=2482727 RepID=A0A3E2NY23_9SPHI|nr:N-acetyltransferase [Mucilaginibacter terrenus]RFZ85839.1 N-acetyltransferase [Mucilaginibacter terrenus]